MYANIHHSALKKEGFPHLCHKMYAYGRVLDLVCRPALSAECKIFIVKWHYLNKICLDTLFRRKQSEAPTVWCTLAVIDIVMHQRLSHII